jgi:carbon monoxide dehydrogenase subunit G
MELQHAFTVPVPVERAWRVLLDIERIAPCMPGATIDEVNGDEFSGSVKVKVGPMQVTYRGDARFTEKDEAAHRATIQASGREARGAGTATATVTAQLRDAGGSTDVEVITDLAITGKPAQFGRGVMADVGGKLIGKFAACLADELGREAPDAAAEEAAATGMAAAAGGAGAAPVTAETGATEPDAPPPAPHLEGVPASSTPERPTAEAIDLFDVAGDAVGKRLAPVAGVLVALFVLLRLRRRRRRARD